MDTIDFTQFDEDGFCTCYEEVGEEDLQDEGFVDINPEDFQLEVVKELRDQLAEHNLTILETWPGGDPGMGIMLMVVPLDEFEKARKAT